MSLGLLTFHRQLNYGGVLQALALHDTLHALSGEPVETINLWMDPRDSALLGKVANPNLPLYARVRNAFKARRFPIGREAYEVRRAKTRHLLETRLNLSAANYRSSRDLRRLPPYETVVVGSDQVWNYDLLRAFKGRNPWLCLDLPATQDRVAYAASFGVSELPADFHAEYRRALSAFRAITVRERSGCDLLGSLLGPETPGAQAPVLDPTLLWSEADWRREIAARPTPERYLLCYWLADVSPERLAWLKRVSEQMALPIVLLVSKPLRTLPDVSSWLTLRFDADPLDFVALIAHAEGIVTDSFHGLQFSALFRRRIVCYVEPDTGGTSASARFHDFCQRYGVGEVCRDIACFYQDALPPLVDLANRLDGKRLEADRLSSLSRLAELLKR